MEHHDIFGRKRGAERTKENNDFKKKVEERMAAAKSKALEAKKGKEVDKKYKEARSLSNPYK